MKRETLFLKMVILFMAIPVLAVCIFVVPPLSSLVAEAIPNSAFLQFIFLLAMYATAIAYYVALYQA